MILNKNLIISFDREGIMFGDINLLRLDNNEKNKLIELLIDDMLTTNLLEDIKFHFLTLRQDIK